MDTTGENSLGKTGSGSRVASENRELESRPKRRKEDKGKSKMVASSDECPSHGDLEERVVELQSAMMTMN